MVNTEKLGFVMDSAKVKVESQFLTTRLVKKNLRNDTIKINFFVNFHELMVLFRQDSITVYLFLLNNHRSQSE